MLTVYFIILNCLLFRIEKQSLKKNAIPPYLPETAFYLYYTAMSINIITYFSIYVK